MNISPIENTLDNIIIACQNKLYLIESGVDRETAFLASEMISKGQACEKSPAPRWHEKFLSLPIPEEIREVAKNYLYLFPRAHCIEYVLIFARLAYYSKTDSRAFSKIVYKKNLNTSNGLSILYT